MLSDFVAGQLGEQPLHAVLVGVPVGVWLSGVLADRVSEAIGVGPGWMPLPDQTELAVLAPVALVLSAGLGALTVARLARRPAADFVRRA